MISIIIIICSGIAIFGISIYYRRVLREIEEEIEILENELKRKNPSISVIPLTVDPEVLEKLNKRLNSLKSLEQQISEQSDERTGEKEPADGYNYPKQIITDLKE